jgi:hypothetical protein
MTYNYILNLSVKKFNNIYSSSKKDNLDLRKLVLVHNLIKEIKVNAKKEEENWLDLCFDELNGLKLKK